LLGRDPSDGPGFTVVSNDDDHDRNNWNWNIEASEDDEEETRSKREREVRRFVNQVQSRVLANQLEALDEARYVDGLDFDTWRAAVAAEAAAMDRESLRILWEEGLPEQIRDSLEPYRDRLDATYDPMTSILEMGLVEHE